MRAVNQKCGASIVECGDDRFRVRSDFPQACECSSHATLTEVSAICAHGGLKQQRHDKHASSLLQGCLSVSLA